MVPFFSSTQASRKHRTSIVDLTAAGVRVGVSNERTQGRAKPLFLGEVGNKSTFRTVRLFCCNGDARRDRWCICQMAGTRVLCIWCNRAELIIPRPMRLSSFCSLTPRGAVACSGEKVQGTLEHRLILLWYIGGVFVRLAKQVILCPARPVTPRMSSGHTFEFFRRFVFKFNTPGGVSNNL